MSGKRFSIYIFTVLMCCSVAGCGNASTGSDPSNANASVSGEAESKSAETPKETTPPATTPQVTATEPIQIVSYISEYDALYYEERDVYVVYFALLDSSECYMDASGTADIQIYDGQNCIFSKNTNFSKKDFNALTYNGNTDDESYVCFLEIPRSDIKDAASSEGTLSLKVSGDGFDFEELDIPISDLPTKEAAAPPKETPTQPKEASIHLPSTPISITERRYFGTSYATISDISYETKNSGDSMTLTVNYVLSLDSKVGHENVADNIAIHYKLTDSEGFVVESDNTFTARLNVGDKSKEHFIISDLNPSETYTLTLEDPS